MANAIESKGNDSRGYLQKSLPRAEEGKKGARKSPSKMGLGVTAAGFESKTR